MEGWLGISPGGGSLRHFLDFSGMGREEILGIIDHAIRFKHEGYPSNSLRSRVVAMLFEKPSTRTRVSIASAVARMGGESIYLPSSELQLARGEPIKDTALVLSRYVDAVVARLNKHSSLLELAEHSSVPVINALTDLFHPCQALADVMTMFEHSGRRSGIKLAYIGDANNVCNSLLQIFAILGLEIAIATPPRYGIRREIAEQAEAWAAGSRAKITLTESPEEAVRDADFVYTDVFISMGMEEEAEERRRAFLPRYQVTERLMGMAKKGARFMHCMPMRRGEEVEAAVADGPSSIILDQAENRMHTAAALLYLLLAR